MMLKMLEDGIYTKDRYLERVKVLENELNILNNKYKELKNKKFDKEDKIKNAIPILENVLKEYWNLDNKSKNILLKTIIKKVEYTKTKRKLISDPVDNNFELKIFLKI